MKNIFIIGSNGQDGKILIELLNKKKFNIYRFSKTHLIQGRGRKIKFNILKFNDVCKVVKKYKPIKLIYLVAYKKSSEQKVLEDAYHFTRSLNAHVFGLYNFLEASRIYSKDTKIFYASSSKIFSNSSIKKQNNKTRPNPNSIYGLTKFFGNQLCNFFREHHKLFCSVGIFYNHESEYSSKEFVLTKIIENSYDVYKKKKKKLVLLNTSNRIDIGYAVDYMRAVIKILNKKKSEEFIISTGKLYSIKDIVKYVFQKFELSLQKNIEIKNGFTTVEKNYLSGDNYQTKKKLNWTIKHDLYSMIDKIIEKKYGKNFNNNSNL